MQWGCGLSMDETIGVFLLPLSTVVLSAHPARLVLLTATEFSWALLG